ncbi:NAD(P)-binding protein [Periconia macrospinosa]|uniref:NAD(P)-binding protein n=1 Tax=Periconia macrospinosa TaxID=97972 RepID=A0A2V1DKX7_9PLEO|nr:NAD(P)-binding protein [Periconia macrospinosa]
MATVTTTHPLKILITGGARGIGRGLFRHFLRAGHSVYILDSNETELAHVRNQAPSWVPSASSSATPTWKASDCDLSDRRRIAEIVSDVRDTFDGRLDVLINNAFATPHTWSDDRGMEDGADQENDAVMQEWDTKIAVGLTAPFLLSRLCVPLLRAGKSTPDASSPGTIINVSSTRAYQSEMNHEAYSAAKAGILGLGQAMAVSLGHRYGIRVNAIVPGWIHVENENEAADEKGMEWEEGLGKEDQEWHPAGRVGKVEDVVRAVEYLVGNGFATGQEITLDGGVGRKMVYPE